MYLSGHVHAFERSLPVLDNVPYPNDVSGSGNNGGNSGGGGGVGASVQSLHASSSRMVYEDPVAPVHIVNGAGGCIEVNGNKGETTASTWQVFKAKCHAEARLRKLSHESSTLIGRTTQ